MESKARILIVDDEPAIVELLTYALEEEGFVVEVAVDGPSALRMALVSQPSLVLLDIMLPGLDGLRVCQELRSSGNVPIILMSARGSEADRVAGLELQADDYVVKPFSVRELIARIRTVLRRTDEAAVRAVPIGADTHEVKPSQSRSFELGLLRLDHETFEAFWDDVLISLTRLQFDLLSVMAKRPRMVFTRQQLLELVWGTNYTDDVRTVDSMIKRLRSNLRDAGAPSELIVSRRDLGYCLEPGVATPST
jgi:DNA-binding response OmpR family regulator